MWRGMIQPGKTHSIIYMWRGMIQLGKTHSIICRWRGMTQGIFNDGSWKTHASRHIQVQSFIYDVAWPKTHSIITISHVHMWSGSFIGHGKFVVPLRAIGRSQERLIQIRCILLDSSICHIPDSSDVVGTLKSTGVWQQKLVLADVVCGKFTRNMTHFYMTWLMHLTCLIAKWRA